MHCVCSELGRIKRGIDRYLIAFEKGTIPEEIAGARLRELAERSTELGAREAELRRSLAAASSTRPKSSDRAITADVLAARLRSIPPQTLKPLIRLRIGRDDVSV